MMDSLFTQLDAGQNGSKQRTNHMLDNIELAENKKILAESENLISDLDNLDEELNNLEAKLGLNPATQPKHKMDVEKQQITAKKTQNPVYSTNNTGFDTFIKTLYSRQNERSKENAFILSNSQKDEIESNNYELDLIDKKAQFYLIDVQEDFQNKSRLLVYGKIKVKNQTPVSCCLVVNGMERRYYFFKRENDTVVSHIYSDY